MKKNILFLLYLAVFVNLSAQSFFPNTNQKGRFYIYGGWNRGFFTTSDIHFSGQNYDFTLQNVVAHDRQTPFAFDPYFHPMKFTIPQTNMRVGYFFASHYNVSFGIDHMKYVMDQNQSVKMTGHIQDTQTQYDGVYDNQNMVLTDDFLRYEHTNGLNYVNAEVCRFDEIFRFDKIKSAFAITEGVGVGGLVPRTDTKLLNYARHDEFHLSGYGVSAKVGLNLTLFRYFMLQSEVKGGFIHLPDVLTTYSDTDKASQMFGFLQTNIVFGATVSLDDFKRKKN